MSSVSKPPKPKKPSKAELQAARLEKLVQTLRDARAVGQYPLKAIELSRRVEPPSDDSKLLTSKAAQSQLIVLSKDADCPVVLAGDEELLASSAAWLQWAAQLVRTKRTAKGPLVKPLKNFVSDAGIKKPLAATFEAALARRVQAKSLPAEIVELLPPPAATPAEVAERLVRALTTARDAQGDYPLGELALFAAARCDAKAKETKAALKEPAFVQRVAVCLGTANAKQVGYVLQADLQNPSPRLFNAALERALAKSAKTKTSLFAAKDLAAALLKDKKLQPQFAAALEHGSNFGSEIGWLYSKGLRQFFRRCDVEPRGGAAVAASSPAKTAAPGASPADFAAAFDAAYTRVDARAGNRNFVKALDLRNELPQFSRAEFDAGLRALRIADRFTMEAAHGGAVQLTDAEREAGVREGNLLLVYVSRK